MAAGLDLAGISALLTDWDTEGKGFVTGSAFKKGLGDLGFNLSSVRAQFSSQQLPHILFPLR